jgi:hypothetical protein
MEKCNVTILFFSVKKVWKGMKCIKDTQWESCVSCSSLFDGANNYLCAKYDSKNKG